jgi:hypothetical protein
MICTHIHDLWDSAASTLTCCGLDVWGIKSQWDEIFYPVLTNAETLQASCTMVLGLVIKLLKHGTHHPLPSSTRLRMGRSYNSTYPLGLHRHVMR